MLIIEYEDTIFKVGKNAKENWKLLEENQEYMWFHLDSFPSGHCIVESPELNKEIIKLASMIVKENSKYKNYKNLGVKYLQIKNIKKTKNPGEVKLLKKGEVFFI